MGMNRNFCSHSYRNLACGLSILSAGFDGTYSAFRNVARERADKREIREWPLEMGSKDFPRWKKYLLELAGTTAICFFGPATIVATLLVPWLDHTSRLFLDALVPGVTLGTCIVTFSKYSGSHVNPAITVTFASSGSLRKWFVLPYVTFQLMGALLGGFLLRTVFDSEVPSAYLGSNKLGTGVSPLEGIALEVIGTMALCLVVLWVVASVRGTMRQGAIVGATLTALIFFVGPISGGSFNPFRSLGPALFSGYLDGLYVYLVGPVVGAALAGALFQAVRSRSSHVARQLTA
jgi:glycerol uptake facilitator-like aquaporin